MDTALTTAKLKLYVDGVLQLQNNYGWMMDRYVLDFFTDNLWEKLPEKWADVLSELQPEEIAYFFLEMPSPFKFKQNSQKPKFRKIWPLELLAFLASCHALKLDNQTWINQAQNSSLNNAVENDTNSRTFDIKSKTLYTSNVGNIQKDSGQCITQHQNTQESQSVFLQRAVQNSCSPFRRHIKQKKQYEIDILSKVVCEQTEKLRCWNIVDVGAGLGHLSRILSYGYKLRVATIEGDSCHQSGAEKIDKKVLAHLQKQEYLREGDETANKSLVHITHHINADISADQFSKVVSGAFSTMKINAAQTSTNSQDLSEISQDNFIIVGLHTCGDLASTLLRVFSECQNAVGLISVGCCYMKLSHEKVRTDKETTSQRTEKCNLYSTKPYPTEISDTSQEKGISISDQNISEYTDPSNCSCQPKGDDESASIHEKYEVEDIGATVPHDPPDLCGRLQEETRILGYPMSDCVTSLCNHQQTYNALESACHAIDRYHKKLLERSPTLKLHCYRALLELLLKQKRPDCPRRQIRTLKTKKAAKMTFSEYVTSACDILGIDEGRPTAQDIQVVKELHAGKLFNVVVFYVLKLLMAPVVEGLILVDRLIYIREKHPEMNSRISMLFDPDISPRNFAIIADKQKQKI